MRDQAEESAAAAGRRAAGELESAVLAVLQDARSALSPAEVRERIGGSLAYTTVVGTSIMRIALVIGATFSPAVFGALSFDMPALAEEDWASGVGR